MLQDSGFEAAAIIGSDRLSNQNILNDELARARHALAYLKHKIGNDRMRELLNGDLLVMRAQVQQ